MPLLHVLLLSLVILLTPGTGFALDAAQTLNQVSHTAWLTQDGSFGGTPQAISQDMDGYVWIGTSSGVDLFDGVRFVRWNPSGGTDANTASVHGIIRARDGGMWLATDRRLFGWKDGVLTPYRRDNVNAAVEDSHGAVYLTRSRYRDKDGPLCQARDRDIRCFGAKDGVPFFYAQSMLADRAGNLWVASSTSLLRWKQGSSEIFTPPADHLKGSEGLLGITALAERPAGGMWVGMHAESGGLQQLVSGRWEPVVLPGFDGSKLNVSTLFLDREDNLWIGTLDAGIYRISGARVDHFARPDGLSSNAVNDIFEDRERDIWTATSKGIDRFRNLRVTNFSLTEGLSADSANSILPTKDGVVWVGNSLGLDAISIDGENAHVEKATQAFKSGRVTSLMQDRDGQLWVGAGNDLWIKSRGGLKPVVRPDGQPLGVIVNMAHAPNGDVWASGNAKNAATLYRIHDATVVEEFTEAQIPHAFDILADPHDGVWFALASGALGRFSGGRFQSFEITALPRKVSLSQLSLERNGTMAIATPIGYVEWKDGASQILATKNGLPCEYIHSFQFDDAENIWFYAKCGILEVTHEDLDRWRANAATVVSVRHWDILDGADPLVVPFSPSSGKSPDGKIWFVNGRLVQMVDPRHLIENREPPLIRIERLYVDQSTYGLEKDAKLPPNARDVEIDFTAPTFVLPSKVRFRYRLDGYDKDWNAPSARRVAFYTNLPPGRYQFHVVAANEDGLWNNTGATIGFVIAQAWYQTSWFLASCTLFLILLIGLFYQVRIRQVRRNLMTRFEDRLAERTRLAQELHDTLIQTIQASKLVASDALDKPSDIGHMRRAMEKLSGWLSQAIEEGRMALNSLRSTTTETGELMRELEREVEHCKAYHPLDIEMSFSDSGREIIPAVYSEVSRIAGEAIRNAFHHSMGTRLVFSLTTVDGLVLRVSDDGVGIEADVIETGKPGHYGLQGMKERAARIGGKLAIHRSADGGTQIELMIPEEIAFVRSRRDWAPWRLWRAR